MTSISRAIGIGLFFCCGIVLSCKKSTPQYQLNQTQINLKYDQTFQFSLTPNMSFEKVNVRNTNHEVGNLDNKGLYTAQNIGTSLLNFVVEGQELQATVEVQPYETFFTEPKFLIRVNKGEIKKLEGRMLLSEDPDALVYAGENNMVDQVIYQFDPANQNLKNCIVKFSAQAPSEERMLTFFRERYDSLGNIENQTFLFVKNSIQVECNLVRENNLWTAYYSSGRLN
jgi:hypothetical protein